MTTSNPTKERPTAASGAVSSAPSDAPAADGHADGEPQSRTERALVVPFEQLSAADLSRVGGKGANLGEMTRAGFPVPPGFCVTTDAFRRFLAGDPELETEVYDRLDALAPDDVAGVREVGQAVRERLLGLPIPPGVETAVVTAWRDMGPDHAYAVRSSATAEDLPGASFAGQQDTALNVRGRAALLDALRRAWVSLFTDRAILYRAKNGFDHRDVALSAVVQRMVIPEVSGILFTADPVSGHRNVASIDAGFGLGEALVQGVVSADNFRVDKRSGELLERRVAEQHKAIRPLPDGGTTTVDLSPEDGARPALSDAQAVALAALGTRIEDHYGRPQDIEWVIDAAGDIYIVQSRPITALYPLPEPPPPDKSLHVYASFGHAQVMTDAMSPMGRSVIRTVFPFGKGDDPLVENPWLAEAGGRLYLDATPALRLAPTRQLALRFVRVADRLIAAALREVITRPAFEAGDPPVRRRALLRGVVRWVGPVVAGVLRRLVRGDPAAGLPEVARRCDALVAEARRSIGAASPGAARLRAARSVLPDALPKLLRVMPPVMGAGYAAHALLGKLVGDRAQDGDLEAVERGLRGNVTTEMDLAVGDLADAAHAVPPVAERLRSGDPATAIADIEDIDGAEPFLTAWQAFLERYGMRGPSEIDIARPRWREDPSSLVQMVAGSLHGEPGAHRAHQQRTAAANAAAGERLVAAAAHGVLGPLRARLARRLLALIRGGMPVREHPKFALIRVLGLARTALLEAGDQLVAAGRLERREDVFWLRLGELISGLEQPRLDLAARVAERREAEARYPDLRPPRVMTSEGEIPEVRHQIEDLPPGAMAGTAASTGIVEGTARVVLDPTTTVLSPGEILVAPFTDPGWTPLFINAAALVMEVGGLMTHGSVVAREYGIPAVVGVLEATERIESGQQLRVDGNRGIVEIVDRASADPAPSTAPDREAPAS